MMKKTIVLIPLLACSLCSCLPLQKQEGTSLNKDDLIETLHIIFDNHNYSVKVEKQPSLIYHLDGKKFHVGNVKETILTPNQTPIYIYMRMKHTNI